MTRDDVLSVRRDGPRVTVVMQRPDVHNAFDERLIGALGDTFAALAEDGEARVVVLAGEGPSFSAGADLEWMRRAAELSQEENRADAARLATMLRSVAECPHPVVARVQGGVFGGGLGLVAAADIAVAADSARFAFTETRLGLVPATVAPLVVERIGPAQARRLFLTAQRFDAAEAVAIGLVHRVVPEAELDAAIEETVAALLAGGPDSQRTIKHLVRNVQQRDRANVDDYTATLLAGVRTSEEGQEGVRAFLERRRPAWAPPPVPEDEGR